MGAMAAIADKHTPISVTLVLLIMFGQQIIPPGTCRISLFIPNLDAHFFLLTLHQLFNFPFPASLCLLISIMQLPDGAVMLFYLFVFLVQQLILLKNYLIFFMAFLLKTLDSSFEIVNFLLDLQDGLPCPQHIRLPMHSAIEQATGQLFEDKFGLLEFVVVLKAAFELFDQVNLGTEEIDQRFRSC